MSQKGEGKDRLKLSNQPGRPLIFVILVVTILLLAIVGIELFRHYGVRVKDARPGPQASLQDRLRTPFPREVRDATGTVLVIPSRPVRIISQTLGSDEILLSICQPERIAAFSPLVDDEKFSNVVERIKTLPFAKTTGAEDILRRQPDLIFIASYSRADIVEQLKASRAPVFRFANFDHVEDIKANIRTLGFAIGEDEMAEQLVARMEGELASLQDRIPKNNQSPRAMSYDLSGTTSGKNTLFDDMLRLAGATNVATEKGIEGFRKISGEQLIAWQPEVIVAGAD
ncbi:MAG: ABC transporter substrate-binding protein, partial [Pyrinomonadaceae bacterium]